MRGPDMRRVILESPHAGDIERHLAYARLCVRDCLSRGETPLVSHLLFTQPGILDDAKPAERELGIAAGHAWIAGADAVVVYLDFGISRGMHIGIAAAVSAGKPVEYRRLVLPGGAETRTPQCAETPTRFRRG